MCGEGATTYENSSLCARFSRLAKTPVGITFKTGFGRTFFRIRGVSGRATAPHIGVHV